jgi:hypothetical protein
MNINKSLEHFKWKFENKWKPTEKDIEAFKSIIEYKELQESINLQHNESFAKMWIHQMILLSNSNMYTGERCIQVIDEILSKSVYEWCLELQNQLSIMKFNAIDKNGGSDEELTEALTFTPEEKNVIKFVEREITRCLNKFEK